MSRVCQHILGTALIAWVILQGIMAWWTQLHYQPLPACWQGQLLTLEGRIDDLVTPLNHGGAQYDVNVERWCIPHHCLKNPGRVRLYWYGQRPAVHGGEQWRWTVKLKPPHGHKNPGLFDYGHWLQWQGFVATGYVVHNAVLLNAHPWSSVLLQWREKFSRFITVKVKNPQQSSILRALATGDRSGFTSNTWITFKNTGTNHLLAISGLHIGLVGAWGYFLWGWLTRCWPSLCYVMARPLWQSSGALIMAGYYSALAGSAISTQRALAMLFIPTLGKYQKRPLSWLHYSLLLIICFIVLEPAVLISPAFYLSFGAIFWIIYSVWSQWGKNSIWQQWAAIQLILTLGLLPLTVWFFQGISTVSIIANAVAIPAFTMVIVPLVLSASIVFIFSKSLSALLLKGASVALIPILHYLVYLSHYGVWFHSINQWWLLPCAMVAIVIAALPRGIGFHRCVALLWFLPLLYWPYPAPEVGEWWFTMLDVGQGLSIVVQTHKHLLVFDTGPAYGKGEGVVVPYLRQTGIKVIDTLVVSHGDRDHSGGVIGLQQQFAIKRFVVGQRNHSELRKGEWCHGGDKWEWDGVHFQFLYPLKGIKKLTANAHSCVLRVSDGTHSILLPGDIGEKQERAILARWDKKNIASSILVAAHHGSCHSNSVVFLKTVAPKKVLFSTGFHNIFHFPCEKLTKYLTKSHIDFSNTAYEGAIKLAFRIK